MKKHYVTITVFDIRGDRKWGGKHNILVFFIQFGCAFVLVTNVHLKGLLIGHEFLFIYSEKWFKRG